MERNEAFELATRLDGGGFEQMLDSRGGTWRISVRLQGLDGEQVAALTALLADANVSGRIDDRSYLDVV
ncbi:MAG: hypothetical protein AABM42_06860 [Actinomycetota bacterium]